MGGKFSEVEHAASVEQSTSTIGARILRGSLGFLDSERLAAGHVVVQGIRLSRWWPACDLAHDRNDLLHNITAGAAGSTLE
jgi:hypothetical protein